VTASARRGELFKRLPIGYARDPVGKIDATGSESERVFTLAWLNSHFESGLRSPLDDSVLSHGAIDPSPWRKIHEVRAQACLSAG
jgi:hypothetical protein